MPMSINVTKKPPRTSEIEQYLLTDEGGETLYAYSKVIYEEITKEMLYEEYDIRNVQLIKKGKLRKISVNSEHSFESESDEENRKKPQDKSESNKIGRAHV